MMLLRQSSTVTVLAGPLLDPSDGVTAVTAGTPTFSLSKNGGTLAARSSATAVAHDADGFWAVELDATDTGTLGRLRVETSDAATYLPVWEDYMIVPQAIYDALVADSDTLPVDMTQILGSAALPVTLQRLLQQMTVVTVGAGSTTKTIVTDAAETTADHYVPGVLSFSTGALAGQKTMISGYDGAGSFSVEALSEAPANGDVAVVL